MEHTDLDEVNRQVAVAAEVAQEESDKVTLKLGDVAEVELKIR